MAALLYNPITGTLGVRITAANPAGDAGSYILSAFVQRNEDGTPVTPGNTVIGGTATNRSGTITTGGTAQSLMAANTARRGWSIKNLSSASLWFNEIGGGAVVSQPSFELKPGESYESPASFTTLAAISIIGATTGQAFAAREW